MLHALLKKIDITARHVAKKNKWLVITTILLSETHVNTSSKIQELGGIGTFHPSRAKVGEKCVSGDLEKLHFTKF